MTAEKVFPKSDGDILYGSEANSLNIVNVAAGENITAGNVVFIKKNDGEAYISSTGTADDIRADGIALTSANEDATTHVLIGGNYVTSGLTANEVYYLGNAGAISTTKSCVEIGVATSTTNLFVNVVQDDADPIGTVKHILANITGVPTYNMTAFWVLADGTELSDAESPLNGQTVPDLNGDNLFLRSADTAGGTGGQATSGREDTNHGAEAGFSYAPDGEDNQPPYHDAVAIIKIK